MKKLLLTTTTLAATLAITSATWADNKTPPGWHKTPSETAAMGTAMYDLEEYLGKMYKKVGEFIYTENYQSLKELSTNQKTNTSKTEAPVEKVAKPAKTSSSEIFGDTTTAPPDLTSETPTKKLSPFEAVADKAAEETSNNLHNTLLQPYYVLYSNSSNHGTVNGKLKTANGEKYKDYWDDNNLPSLTVNKKIQASDVLYTVAGTGEKKISSLSDSSSGGYVDQKLAKPPEAIDNDFLNFAALITPTFYASTEQQKTAHDYLKYAAQSTQNFTRSVAAKIDFEALYGSPQDLVTVKRSAAYQQYQYSMRSALAIRSVSMDILNRLIAERTPMKGLVAGKHTDASPLQVEAYRANHRIEDPHWYARVTETASPATVQRETLIVLAEIEQQNYQAQADRELIMAELAAANLQSGAADTNAMLLQAVTAMNTEIQKDTTEPPTTSSSTSSPATISTTSSSAATATSESSTLPAADR